MRGGGGVLGNKVMEKAVGIEVVQTLPEIIIHCGFVSVS